MEKFRVPNKQPALEMAEKERRYFEKNGYWLCLGCKGPCAELANAGEYNQCCAKCKSIVQWIPPKTGMQNPGTQNPSKVRDRMEDERVHETLSSSAAKANLAEAAFKGFYTCTSCGHIVQVKDGKCAQCGSEKVIFNKPVLGSEIVEGRKPTEGSEGVQKAA